MISLLALFTIAGCQSAQVAEPLTATTSGNDAESMMNFWHTLAERNIASHDEAFHAVALFAVGCDPAADYAERVERFKACGWLPAKWNEPANEAITRGTLSMVLARVLKIRGGLSMLVLGPTPRYAMRELQALNIMPAGTDNQSISGSEILTVIGQAEDYMVLRGMSLPAQNPEAPPPTPPTPGETPQ